MKRVTQITILSLVVLSLTFFSNCKSDDSGDGGLTIEAQARANLAKTWDVTTVNRESQDITGEFTGFTLTFGAEGSFSASNDIDASGNDIFAGSQWAFEDASALTNPNQFFIVFGPDAVSVNVTDTNLTLTFSINDDSSIGNRVQGIDGEYRIEATAQ